MGIGLLLTSSVTEAATARVRAVALNGSPIAPTSTLDVEAGDVIETEIMVSGWGTVISTVKTYQITINTDGMIDQPGPHAFGSIKPLNYDTPRLHPSGFYINIAPFGRGVCSSESTNAGVSCVSSPVACSGGACVDGICDGGTNASELCATADNQCIGGSCGSHPGFLFVGFSGALCIASTDPVYRLGCTLIQGNGPADPSRCIGGSADGAPCDGDGDCQEGMCDVVEFYTGTVMLEVGDDASGVFRFEALPDPASILSSPSLSEASITPIALVLDTGPHSEPGACCVRLGDCRDVVEPECLALGGVFRGPNTHCLGAPDFCACPSIVDAVPTNCAIDARYPHRADGSPIGFESVEVALSAGTEMSQLGPESFPLSFVGGTMLNPPVVTAVTPLGGVTVRLDFNKPLPLQRWSCLGMACAPAGAKDVCWGHLPGDVNGNGTANAADVLDLIDFLNGVHPEALAWYQTDVDASGATIAADVLAVIDLLNGAGPFDSWNNVNASGGSCPTRP